MIKLYVDDLLEKAKLLRWRADQWFLRVEGRFDCEQESRGHGGGGGEPFSKELCSQ